MALHAYLSRVIDMYSSQHFAVLLFEVQKGLQWRLAVLLGARLQANAVHTLSMSANCCMS